jgi:hypothetical protein
VVVEVDAEGLLEPAAVAAMARFLLDAVARERAAATTDREVA